jgi:response regulator RpfG family c-di-GMP phosphodiesterase
MILLDIDMPEMNGDEAIKVLKAKEETKDIPVIFLTGKTRTENELEGLDLGAIDYITKPFMPPLLLKRIEVHQSSRLHDAGKTAISDRILQKPGRLTDEEFGEMKKHAAFGVQIIEKIEAGTTASNFLKDAKIFAGTRHEKWDSSGCPKAPAGETIALQGRIMALADVYDALVSERPYKKAFSLAEAVKTIQDSKGTQFDPVLTGVFVAVMDG